MEEKRVEKKYDERKIFPPVVKKFVVFDVGKMKN